MHDGIEGVSGEEPVQQIDMAELALNELGPAVYGSSMAFGEIVQDGDFVPGAAQGTQAMTSDVSGATGD
jgi:hypothetical protein